MIKMENNFSQKIYLIRGAFIFVICQKIVFQTLRTKNVKYYFTRAAGNKRRRRTTCAQ